MQAVVRRLEMMMNEDDVIGFMGRPPDKVLTQYDRLKSNRWMCSGCGRQYRHDPPIPSPAPCDTCGGIFFETLPPGIH